MRGVICRTKPSLESLGNKDHELFDGDSIGHFGEEEGSASQATKPILDKRHNLE